MNIDYVNNIVQFYDGMLILPLQEYTDINNCAVVSCCGGNHIYTRQTSRVKRFELSISFDVLKKGKKIVRNPQNFLIHGHINSKADLETNQPSPNN